MSESFSWTEVREQAVSAFGGELPRAETEQAVIDVFASQPRVVVNAIAEVAEAKNAGRIRSGWAVLRSAVARPVAGADLVATDTDERRKAEKRAKAWIENVSCLFDSRSEVEAELRERLLSGYADELLIARLLDRWSELRPKGEQVEAEEAERAEVNRTWRVEQQRARQERARQLEGVEAPT